MNGLAMVLLEVLDDDEEEAFRFLAALVRR
jgi:hypothetical protein